MICSYFNQSDAVVMPKKPVYQMIKDSILANIHTGVWQVGSAIPTEMALAEQFGVSRMTVNRALKELTDIQVLERRQGSGTFVAQKQFSDTFVTVHNIRQDIQRMGKSYDVRVIDKKLVAYDALEIEAQRVFVPEQKIFEVLLVHFGNDVPLQVERRWVDLVLVPEFELQDFTQVNTSDYLMSQVPLVRGQYQIEALFCPKLIADLLQMPSQYPALRLSRHTYSQDQVVTYVQMWHNGATFSFGGVLG